MTILIVGLACLILGGLVVIACGRWWLWRDRKDDWDWIDED